MNHDFRDDFIFMKKNYNNAKRSTPSVWVAFLWSMRYCGGVWSKVICVCFLQYTHILRLLDCQPSIFRYKRMNRISQFYHYTWKLWNKTLKIPKILRGHRNPSVRCPLSILGILAVFRRSNNFICKTNICMTNLFMLYLRSVLIN